MKNWKVRNKIMVSFLSVVILMGALSLYAISMTVYRANTLMDHVTAGQEPLLRASTDVMNMRRMTGMIHAFHGDVGRIETYVADFNNSYAAVLEYLDEYLEKSEGNPYVESAVKRDIRDTVSEMKGLLHDYRTLLFEPNVVFAKAGDVESLMPTSAQHGPLILAVAGHIDSLIKQEKAIEESGFGVTRHAVARTQTLTYVVIFIAVASATVLSIYLYRQVGLPLHDYADWMRMTAKGDVVWKPDELVILDKFKGRRDEIGVIVECYVELCAYIQQKCDELTAVSNGDLTVEVVPNSENDLLAFASKNMVEKLNGMFGEIDSTSRLVESNAHQLANGSQALANSSTEQAATVEELAASVNEIAVNTENNADLAGKAASLASTIKNNAEKGSYQMDEMIAAVNEINQASRSIGNVIKIIDDIAFQTNILALNAAVEAARAGQHGKGFAVVADEVRNLAAKSAAAAKDTSSLIANSMEKAEQGTHIAQETASSLAAIVLGINESNMLIEEIAQTSKVQSAGINQLNTGIDHVSQTISETSATAQETSAISQEMNDEAVILEKLVAQFKLRRVGEAGHRVGTRAPQNSLPTGFGMKSGE